jgi:hypothetical protein
LCSTDLRYGTPSTAIDRGAPDRPYVEVMVAPVGVATLTTRPSASQLVTVRRGVPSSEASASAAAQSAVQPAAIAASETTRRVCSRGRPARSYAPKWTRPASSS